MLSIPLNKLPFEAIESAPIAKKQISDYDNLLWWESVLVVETLLHQNVGSFPKESQKYIEVGSNNSMHHYYKNCIFYKNGSSSRTRRVDLSLLMNTKAGTISKNLL